MKLSYLSHQKLWKMQGSLETDKTIPHREGQGGRINSFRQGQQEATLSISNSFIKNHGKNSNIEILSKLALFCCLGCLWSLVSVTVVSLGLVLTNFAILIKLSIFHFSLLLIDKNGWFMDAVFENSWKSSEILQLNW